VGYAAPKAPYPAKFRTDLVGTLSERRIRQQYLTYIPMRRGFLYLVAVMDWASRKVLSWRVSNTMDADFCIEALEEALERFGKPEIFNTDQGSQFTSPRFTGVLREAGVRISMDGRGRWMDNVFIERLWRSLKCECIVCCEHALSQLQTRAELYRRWGRPPGVGLQGQTSNRHKLRG
jgi:putative transposase